MEIGQLAPRLDRIGFLDSFASTFTSGDKMMEEFRCIFCGKNNQRVVLEENGYSGVKCRECELIYLSRRPDLGEILGRYAEDRATHAAKTMISDDISKRLHGKHTLGIIRRYLKRGSLLEIGAGAGYFLDEARKEGFEVYGIEINKNEARFISESLRIPCETSPLDPSSFEGRKFNVIYHRNVLSHFHDPLAGFRGMQSRLTEGGMLVFETGNLGEVKDKYYTWFPEFEFPDHLFFFGRKSVTKLLQLTGFEIIRILGYDISWQLWMGRMMKKMRGPYQRQESSTSKGDHFVQGKKADLLSALKTTHAHLSHFLTYKIGTHLLKRGRPATLIVVARKT